MLGREKGELHVLFVLTMDCLNPRKDFEKSRPWLAERSICLLVLPSWQVATSSLLYPGSVAAQTSLPKILQTLMAGFSLEMLLCVFRHN